MGTLASAGLVFINKVDIKGDALSPIKIDPRTHRHEKKSTARGDFFDFLWWGKNQSLQALRFLFISPAGTPRGVNAERG